MSQIKRLGWKRGLPRLKPFHFASPLGILSLPPEVDLEVDCPPVYDQGDLGSCTAQASCAMGQVVAKKLGYKWYIPSRLAVYYWTRELEKTVQEDAGATIYDTMVTLVTKGLPREELWWYNINKFAVKPNMKVATDGDNHRVMQQLAVNQHLHDLRACLAEGFPFIFGFAVYDSFMSNAVAESGICPMPKHNEELQGGHAVMAVGYNDARGMFKIRNSWGKNWGQKGYFWMPYDFVANNSLSDDFWTMRGYATWR